MNRKKVLVFVVVVMAVVAFFAAGAHRHLTFEQAKAQHAALQAFYVEHPGRTVAGFFLLYIAVTGLSIPGATVLTLIAGAVFGLLWGVVVVSFASALGATVAFLVSRYLLRDWVQQRFARQLRTVNDGIKRDGGFYLFTLRLIPVVPFFVINLVMGLTPIRTLTFYWVGQIGMLPATILYVNAGKQVAQIASPRDILSWEIFAALTLIGIFPLVAKKVMDMVRARRVYARWHRPAHFDRNLVVIGAGAAGLVSAYIAATVRAKVTLVEQHRMGGDCLYTGCVPSKALLRSAKLAHQFRTAGKYGLRDTEPLFSFADVMERVQRVIRTVEPHDSAKRYQELGVECIEGVAKITSPWNVAIGHPDGTITGLTTRAIVIAAGARPFIPPIPGIEQVKVLTSENVWDLRSLPSRLVVLGGGPIGCEMAQAFARLGSRVTQVEMLPRLLAREDPEVSDGIARIFAEEGIAVLAGHKALRVEVEGAFKRLVCEHQGREVAIDFDELLCAVGRIANTEGYGLEELGIPAPRTVQTNEYLQTLYPNIYACGDVAGPFQFTHTAAHQAWYASVNALFGGLRKFRADYSVIPWATFTDPEVARVGLNETEAREQGVPCEVAIYGIDDLDRAIADEAAHGMVKVLTVPRRDRILGATIVGEHAGDLIAEFVSAMKHGIGLNKILGTIHIYPTLAEANKYAAGVWKKAHAPQGVLRLLEKYHRWRRG